MIETARLLLEDLDTATAAAIVAGDRTGRSWQDDFPREDDQDAAAMTVRHPDPVFGSYVIVEKASGLAVGTIGFHGPPDPDGAAMVGYGLVAAARERGYATEALRALVGYAFTQPGVRTLTADPLTGNAASHRVLEKAGFHRTHTAEGAHWYALEAPA
ncbi:GNAT family N-acetyltransferase [Actinoplanes sp. URMC 104]|uniref:GNAT family N-acetyltransferase n=1 Tax=Actinoplanes sp. URMC 104 TaxID=3423409 RepID=UPI003F1C3D66